MMQEHLSDKHVDFKASLRIESDLFQELRTRVGPRIEKSVQ